MRYETASELADDLDRYLQGLPIQARPMSHLRRGWYWLLGVPIFGAVLDHRVVEPTDAHRWVQRGLISAALMMVLAWLAMVLPENFYRNRMPKEVRIASGVTGGSYDRLASSICDALSESGDCVATSVRTVGSQENVERLENGDVDLALLQADAIGSPKVTVVSPLYYEAVHIFVRKDAGIQSLSDLRDRRVNVGEEKAGIRLIAGLVLESAGLSFDDVDIVSFDWHRLLEGHLSPVLGKTNALTGNADEKTQAEDQLPLPTEKADRLTQIVDAAIVVSRLGSSDVAKLLSTGEYKLLALSNAWELALLEPSLFHPLLMTSNHYPDCELPLEGIATVTTTAFLATTEDTPAVLIQAVLKHLFTPEMVAATGIVSAERAAHWQGLVWHPAAREFFRAYRITEADRRSASLQTRGKLKRVQANASFRSN